MENIHSILPYHIKHLKVLINNLKQINTILNRCKILATLTIYSNNNGLLNLIAKYFDRNMSTAMNVLRFSIQLRTEKNQVMREERLKQTRRTIQIDS
ncbi:unnamed protein product [Rotaria sordida]|uniref:Uncharacterized protein n=2 Tax=Rotaria sordida TaxID=392033 RepID=A0A819UN26_9BILA|nr:unnamed protein product [Rotaria sordida]